MTLSEKIKTTSVAVALGLAGVFTGLSLSSASATVDTSYYVVKNYIEVDAHSTSNIDAICDDGDTATGGSARLNNAVTGDWINSSPYQVGLSQQATGWTAEALNSSGSAKNLFAFVVCKDT